MTTAIIIFAVSFLGIIAVLFNKLQHINKGKAFVSVSARTDARVEQFSKNTVGLVKHAPKMVAQTAAFLAIKGSLAAYEKAKKKVYPRIAHLVDAVKGKDIPKNRGSASFFLASIKKDHEVIE
ncbi:MAG TPA: hypothetical protein VEC13_01340 [Candidatus Paceibacterota bacterium]|nr:hypothetical protein [Candidatus Paceibacterota bacterium]